MSSTVLDSLDIPLAVKTALIELTDRIVKATGDNLHSLILYGSAVRGKFLSGKSDINLAIILEDVSPAHLDAIASPLRQVVSSNAISTIVMTPSEVPASADSFPLKFLYMRDFHKVLHGDDGLFRSLEISMEHIRLRLEQELRNLSLRLRAFYIASSGDPEKMRTVLVKVARVYFFNLPFLLQLAGERARNEEELVSKVSSILNLESAILSEILTVASGRLPSDTSHLSLLCDLMLSVDKAADYVDNLEERKTN